MRRVRMSQQLSNVNEELYEYRQPLDLSDSQSGGDQTVGALCNSEPSLSSKADVGFYSYPSRDDQLTKDENRALVDHFRKSHACHGTLQGHDQWSFRISSIQTNRRIAY